MRLSEINDLVEGTADAAFAIGPNGLIAFWNKAAGELFGMDASQAVGKYCSEILRGIDECGRVCSEECVIRDRAMHRRPVKSYDIEVEAGGKRLWCDVSVLLVNEDRLNGPFTIHIVRPADLRKRFEFLLRNFVVSETSLPTVNLGEMLSNRKSSPSRAVELTRRELEILKRLAKGERTADIAKGLFISPTTTNNHIQHVLKKLSAHTRLEAVRRAEQAGLI